MSLRDEIQAEWDDVVEHTPGGLMKKASPFTHFEAGYQSATERALRIGLDVHAWASARNLNWNTVLTEYERRLKGGDNGN